MKIRAVAEGTRTVKSENAGTTVVEQKKPIENPILANCMLRYSDKELEEYRLLITDRITAAKKELQFFQDQLKGKDERGVENPSFNLEDGSTALEIERNGQLAARQLQYIQNLENALIRIGNKTYGICRVTGKLIDKARLRIVPHATLCVEAKRK